MEIVKRRCLPGIYDAEKAVEGLAVLLQLNYGAAIPSIPAVGLTCIKHRGEYNRRHAKDEAGDAKIDGIGRTDNEVGSEVVERRRSV